MQVWDRSARGIISRVDVLQCTYLHFSLPELYEIPLVFDPTIGATPLDAGWEHWILPQYASLQEGNVVRNLNLYSKIPLYLESNSQNKNAFSLVPSAEGLGNLTENPPPGHEKM
jgi:hypothetical protein